MPETNLDLLPDFLGIGALRSGTTWLDAQLRSHPEVFVPHRRKEIHFFDLYYARGSSWYAQFFRGAPPKTIRGEVTPSYLGDPAAPARIWRHNPRCRFLLILRNPADRAFSQYMLVRNAYNECRPFKQYMEETQNTFEAGLYYRCLERYLEYFDLARFHILVFEQVMEQPTSGLNSVAEFLGVRPDGFDPETMKEKYNASRSVRFRAAYSWARGIGSTLRAHDYDWVVNAAKRLGLPRMFGTSSRSISLDASVRRELLCRYEPDIEALERLTGLDLSGWRKLKSEP